MGSGAGDEDLKEIKNEEHINHFENKEKSTST